MGKRKGRRNRRYENNKRDYLVILGELEGITYIGTLVDSAFSLETQVEFKSYKKNINVEIKEFNKIVNLIIPMQKDEYVDGHSKEILIFVQDYDREEIDTKITNEKSKFTKDTSLIEKKKDEVLKDFSKWTSSFISKNSPTKLKASNLNSSVKRWVGNLLQRY